MPPLTDLQRYSKYLIKNTKQFPCPHCNVILLPKQFEGHCTKHHHINARLRCVWCVGKVSWRKGQKNDRVDHLLECWRSFMALRLHHPTASPNRAPFDCTPMCEPRQFFHHSSDLPPQAYEEVCPMQLDPIQIFQDPNLNLAATCVLKYFELPDAELFHVMVRAVAYPSFVESMAGGICVTLPFSCWCDGGRYPQAKHRQHRHMIVICLRKGYFKQVVWDKISTDDRPGRNYLCKRCKPIASPMHLVNTIGYLSQRKSRCNFSFKDGNVKENMNHFFIFTPLPVDYRFGLVTQWDGGILELVHQEFMHTDAKKLLQAPMTFFNRRWQIRVKDIPGIRMNLALPISERFHPSTEPTPIYLHLTHSNKLYFAPSNAQDTAPLFYSAVEDEWWIPSQHQQNGLKTLKPLFDANVKREAEKAALERQHEEQVQSLRQENVTLKRKHGREVKCLKRAKLELEKENECLKGKYEAADEEVKSLLRQLKNVAETENERLKTKISDLENYIQYLEKKLHECEYMGP